MAQTSQLLGSSNNNFFEPPNLGFPYSDVYVALEGDSESQLIRLLPGSGESPIHCKLINNVNFRAQKAAEPNYEERANAWIRDNLEQFMANPLLATTYLINEHNQHAMKALETNYAALSYCAGDPNDFEPIWVDGHKFNVFRTLFRALKRFRHSTEPRLLWVDQICINQRNTPERDGQVLLMKDIYENADSVKIYLGEEEFLNGVSSNRAFDLLENFLGTKMAAIQRSIYRFGDSHGIERELRKGWYQHYTLNFNSDDIASNDADLMSAIDSMRRYLIDAALGDFWVAFFSLLEKPWWRRCWVIQEVIVARKATINGGDMAVDFDDFVLFLVMALWSLRIRIPGEESNDRTVTLSRMLFTCMQQPYRIAGARVEFDVQTATPMSLLRTFAYAKASDSRDKVYSTLSLLGRERAQGFGLTPTYAPSNTTAAVFIQAAKACITSSEELEVFSETYGASPDSHFGLPSWVPDWTRTEENTNTKCNLIHKIYGFSATGRPGMASSADVTYSYDGLKVLARGILIGKVSSIGAVDEEPDLHTTDNLNNILFTLRSWKQLSKPKSGTEMRQFCQTVTLEQHPPLDALGWDNPNTFEEWVRSLVQTGRRTGLGRPWYRRRFCQLSHGSTSKMAVLPASAEAGDIVCVFWGANVAFVLKERGKWCYLAGEAYVHGVMHGELIEEEDRAWRESAYFGIA